MLNLAHLRAHPFHFLHQCSNENDHTFHLPLKVSTTTVNASDFENTFPMKFPTTSIFLLFTHKTPTSSIRMSHLFLEPSWLFSPSLPIVQERPSMRRRHVFVLVISQSEGMWKCKRASNLCHLDTFGGLVDLLASSYMCSLGHLNNPKNCGSVDVTFSLYWLQVGGSWLKKKQTTVTSSRTSNVKGKEKAKSTHRHLLPRKGPRS